MNYLITESQLEFILENQNLLNDILEKIKKGGINSLTDLEKDQLDRISRGEDIDNDDIDDEDVETEDESESSFNFDPLYSFFDFAPNYESVQVDGKDYEIVINEEDNSLSLIIIGTDAEIYVTPFWENSGDIKIETIEGRSLKMKSDKIPKNSKSMKDYVKLFYSNFIPKIIKKIVS